ncbi:MAG: hypothetical protein MPJ08_01075 [Nitrosopumilus sp.]|nr:hypothetical protein [Nitrosopumilus sp.]
MDLHSPPRKRTPDVKLGDLPYEDIPNQCMILGADPDRMAFGRIYDSRVVITGPYDVVSSILNEVEPITETRLAAYAHADGTRKITLEGLKEIRSITQKSTAGGAICESICTFDNVILDAHYEKIPTVISVRIEYPFNWGMMTNKHEYKCHKSIRVPECGITVEVVQESEFSRTPNYESKEDFLTYTIKADPGIDMNMMMKYVWQLNNFLTVFMGWPVYPQRLTMIDADGTKFLHYPVELFDLKRRIPPTEHTHRMEYDELMDKRFEDILKKWFLLYRRVGRPVSEYFESVRGDSVYRSRFIDHTNTMQRIYRKTNNDTESLLEMLRDAVNIYRGIYEPGASLMESIKETRNHYVHGDRNKLDPLVVTSDFDLAKFGWIVAMLIEGKLLNMVAGDDPDILDPILRKIHKSHVDCIMKVPGFIDYDGTEPGEDEGQDID